MTIFLVISTLFLIIGPILILQEDTHIQIHDTLDGPVPYLTVLANSDKMWSLSNDAVLNQPLNGLIPRNIFPSPLHSNSLFYQIFTPFWAFSLNFVLLHLLGFIGMYFLLKRFPFSNLNNSIFPLGVALCFALLPTYSGYSGYLMAAPLFLFTFLSFAQGRKEWILYFLAFILPFFSGLILFNFFFIPIICVAFLGICIYNKKIYWHFAGGILLTVLGTLLTEGNLIYYQLFGSQFISNREAFHADYEFILCAFQAMVCFRFGQYEALGYQEFIIFPILLLFVLALFNKNAPNIWKASIIFILLGSLAFGFFAWQGLDGIKKAVPFFTKFQFSRIGFLLPTFWYIAFGYSLAFLLKKSNRFFTFLGGLLILFQLSHIVRHQPEITYNMNALLGDRKIFPIYNYYFSYDLNWREVFAKDIFDEIEDYIGKPKNKYRVGSVGVFPGISEVHGYYVIDGYQNFYPMDYKIKFRKAIKTQLEMNKRAKEGFDNWGGKVYLVVGELPTHDTQPFLIYNGTNALKKFELDHQALNELNCNFIFSSLPIENAEKSGLIFRKSFQSKESPLHIFLYEVSSIQSE